MLQVGFQARGQGHIACNNFQLIKNSRSQKTGYIDCSGVWKRQGHKLLRKGDYHYLYHHHHHHHHHHH